MISENNGTVPQLKDYKQQQKNSQAFERYFNNYNEDSSYRTRFFRIFLDEDKKVTNVNMDHIAAVDEKKAVRMTKMAMLRRGKVGLVGSYRYRKEYKDSGLQRKSELLSLGSDDHHHGINTTHLFDHGYFCHRFQTRSSSV